MLLIDRMKSCVTSDVQAEVLVLIQLAISSDIFNSCVAFAQAGAQKLKAVLLSILKNFHRKVKRMSFFGTIVVYLHLKNDWLH